MTPLRGLNNCVSRFKWSIKAHHGARFISLSGQFDLWRLWPECSTSKFFTKRIECG
jgi:hypothetical protein